jgi:hypothetical protein
MNKSVFTYLNCFLSVVALMLAGSLHAQTFSQMELNGSATLADGGSTLRLTPASNSLAGSGFLPTPFTFNESTNFDAAFQFRIYDGSSGGADGLTMVFHSDPDGSSALGGGGVNLGYAGISSSFSVEFDTWDNGDIDDDSGNHFAVNFNGSVDSVNGTVIDPGFDLESGDTIYAWLSFTGSDNLLKIYISEASTRPANPQLTLASNFTDVVGECAWVGFTASTGGASNVHDIEDLQLDWSSDGGCDEYISVPSLSNWAMVLMALLLILGGFGAHRLRR